MKAVRNATAARTTSQSLPAVEEAPVVEVNAPAPAATVAPAEITPASAQPAPAAVPVYLQWWQTFFGFFGGNSPLRPTPAPTPVTPRLRLPGS